MQFYARFGMPRQHSKRDINSTGTGSGSCGVRVILVARDFCCLDGSAALTFSWNFSEMTVYRKQLMLELVNSSLAETAQCKICF